MTKYFSTAETAKLIRKALKEAFPGVKFSVRSDVYSGGSSINVRWTDGPTAKMVESVAGTFSGAYFDGSIDYKGYTKAMIDGETVHFGADFVFCNRDTTRTFLEKVVAAGIRKYGLDRFSGVRIAASCDGEHAYIDSNDYEIQRLLREIAYSRSAYLTPRKSVTAGKVIYLGNDGYSQVGALNVD